LSISPIVRHPALVTEEAGTVCSAVVQRKSDVIRPIWSFDPLGGGNDG